MKKFNTTKREETSPATHNRNIQTPFGRRQRQIFRSKPEDQSFRQPILEKHGDIIFNIGSLNINGSPSNPNDNLDSKYQNFLKRAEGIFEQRHVPNAQSKGIRCFSEEHASKMRQIEQRATQSACSLNRIRTGGLLDIPRPIKLKLQKANQTTSPPLQFAFRKVDMQLIPNEKPNLLQVSTLISSASFAIYNLNYVQSMVVAAIAIMFLAQKCTHEEKQQIDLRPLVFEKAIMEIQLMPVNTFLKSKEIIPVVQDESVVQSVNTIFNNDESHSNESRINRGILPNLQNYQREIFLHHLDQSAMICKLYNIKAQKSRVNRKSSGAHNDSQRGLSLFEMNNDSYNSQNVLRLSEQQSKSMSVNLTRKVKMDVIDVTDKFSKMFNIHHRILGLPNDQSNDTCQSYVQGNNSIMSSSYMEISMHKMSSIFKTQGSNNDYRRRSSTLSKPNPLTLIEQEMLEMKVYQPYLISNETIIQYQKQNQKLSMMDILQTHHLQKKKNTRLFFLVNLNDHKQESQNYTIEEVDIIHLQNNKTIRSGDLEKIVEKHSKFEQESINSQQIGVVRSVKSQGRQSSDGNSIGQQNSWPKKKNSMTNLINRKQKVMQDEDDLSLTSSEISDGGSQASQFYGNDYSRNQKFNYQNEDNIFFFEFQIKQINDNTEQTNGQQLTFLSIKDITKLIKNHKKFCDKIYQDAIENNFSHEQMTPLNPILNNMPLIKQNLINMYSDKLRSRRMSNTTDHQVIEGFEMVDLTKIVQNQKEAKTQLQNIISIEQSAKAIWFYNTNQILRMKFNKNQVKINPTVNGNLISTIWDVIWPFELCIFKRRINIFLITNVLQKYEIIADWELFELIMFNIIQNSMKYNKNLDGDIVITITCKKMKESDQMYILETQVIDTGVGISPEKQKMLFTPFKELKEHIGIMKAENDTLGLGLACSSAICGKLGGDITVKQSHTGMTVVAFKFPVSLKVKTCFKRNQSENCLMQKMGGSMRNMAFNVFKEDTNRCDHIKLIGNERPLPDVVLNFLQKQHLFPLNEASKDNESQSAIPLFKELYQFPNQKIGFQTLENIEKLCINSNSDFSAQQSANSYMSKFSHTKSNSLLQVSNRHENEKKSSIKSSRSIFQQKNIGLQINVRRSINLAQSIKSGRRGSQSPTKLQPRPKPISSKASQSRHKNIPFFQLDQEEYIQQSQELLDVPMAPDISDVDQSSIPFNEINSIDSSDQNPCSQYKQNSQDILGMIKEIDDSESQQYVINSSVENLERQAAQQEDQFSEESSPPPSRQHLKKLKVKKTIVKASQGFQQQLCLMDLKNLNKEDKKLIANQILHSGKCQKVFNKFIENPKLPQDIDIREDAQDIIIDSDREYIKRKGHYRYKKKLERNGIIYQLSQTYQSSEELSSVSDSDSNINLSADSIISHQAVQEINSKGPKAFSNLVVGGGVRPMQRSYEGQESPEMPAIYVRQAHSCGINKQLQLQESDQLPRNIEEAKFVIEADRRSSVESVSQDSSQIDSSIVSQVQINNQKITLRAQQFEELMLEINNEKCDCEPKILIVEDTEFNLLTLQNLIRSKLDIQAHEAINGQVAIDMVRKLLEKPCKCPNRAYKFIIMDIQMPIKDGYQATSEILKLMKENGLEQVQVDKTDKFCNIIALTSYTGDDVNKKCREINMKEVFNKPLKADQLLKSVKKYFFQQHKFFLEYYQRRMTRQILQLQKQQQ